MTTEIHHKKANNVSNGIGFTRTYSALASTVFLVHESTSTDDWVGFWRGNLNGGDLYLHLRNMNNFNFTTAEKTKVALHEVGHGLGLKHQTLVAISVMPQGRRAMNDYSDLDKRNLRFYYGN